MFVKNAVKNAKNNKDPSTIYREIQDVEQFFKDINVSGTGESVNTSSSEHLSPVAAAHRIFTNSMGSIPMQVKRKEGEMRYDVSHPLDRVLKVRANEFMSPMMAGKIIASQAFWYGVGFAYIARDSFAAEVKEIIPLPSSGYQCKRDPSTGAVWYIFQVDGNKPGVEKLKVKLEPSELLIHYFESYDGFNGRGILSMAKETIANDLSAQKYNSKFYQNGARVSGIVEVPEELQNDSRDIIKEDFEKMACGMDNAFRVAVLDMGMKYTQLGISQRDSQYIETRNFTVDEISRFTGIPSYMMQAGKQSYSSNEQQQLDFVTNILVPHVVQKEQEWAYKLFADKEIKRGYYMKANVSSLLRGDITSRSNFYQKMIGMGVYSPDDARSFEDMNPLPDGIGKEYWMSKNYQTINNIIKEGGDK